MDDNQFVQTMYVMIIFVLYAGSVISGIILGVKYPQHFSWIPEHVERYFWIPIRNTIIKVYIKLTFKK